MKTYMPMIVQMPQEIIESEIFCRLDGRPGQAPNAASCLVAWDRSERKLLRELERSGKGKMAIL